MPYVVTQEMLESLTEADQAALVSIYRHRCLDCRLLYKHFYSKEDRHREYTDKRVEFLIQNKYVSAVDYGDEHPALFLTAVGIAAVRRILIYPERRDLTAAALKMKVQLIRHQLYLNAAALDIEAEAKEKNIPYEYYDCKYMEFNGEVMPDGMFRFNEYDIFLEMDMNTEGAPQLAYKWSNYRSYLNSERFYYNERKTVVLFLLCGVKRIEQRRSTILASLGKGLLDKMTPNFDIYVDAPEALQRVLFDDLLALPQSTRDTQAALRQLGFSTSLATSFNRLLSNTEYGFYTRMLSDKNHRVLAKGGRVQEFLMDVMPSGLSASMLAKTVCHNSAALPLTSRLGREVPYLVVGGSDRAISADLKAVNARGIKNTYFTTLDRLQKGITIADAVFQVDQLGRVYHFSDASLREPIYERTI